jgi:DNA-binding CsgD family transcriptional regulator
VLAEALHSLMMVSSYGGEAGLWQSFKDAMARSQGIPLALELNSRTFADPARTSATTLQALESAIAALADEADPTQITRLAIAASYVDRLEGCRTALWRVVHDARQGGAIASGIIARLALGFDDVCAALWDEADQLVNEVIEVCEALGYRIMTWPGRYLEALVAAARGDHERTEELSEALLQWGGPRGIRVGLWYASQARCLAALGRSDFEKAYQCASAISPPGLLAPHVPFALYVLMDLVEAAVHTGRGAEAEAHVAAMQEAHLAALSSRLALMVGASAAIAAPDDRGLELFQATLALPGVERWRFDYARVRLAYGERLRRRRAMTESRVQLNAALEIFEQLRARPWVDRANAELRASGQTKPRAGDNVLDRLTPQEFEIVSLAASGLTNKQIAERMFLSPRTVGGHLHRAFPKLGVETRAALRDALQALPPEQLPRK